MSAAISAAELAEIRARIYPSHEGRLAFGSEFFEAAEGYAKVRLRTAEAEPLQKALNRIVDIYVPLQHDAERLVAEVERLRAKLSSTVCADCNPMRPLLDCDVEHTTEEEA